MNRRVSIVKVQGDRIEEAVRQAVSLAGGLEKAIRSDTKVLVKPNLCRPAPSGSGHVTDCRVTEAITKMVLELGPRSVVIGEGAAAGYDFAGAHSTEEAFRASGVEEVARRLGVEIRNLNRDEVVEVKVERAYCMDKVKIARTALESDFIISVPVMKTHIRTLISLSLKNMKGVLPGEEKRKTHRLGLDMGIADLNSVVKPDFALVDGLVALEGWWQDPEDRVEMGILIAGSDPVAVDAVGAYLMDFDPKQIMHLQYVARRQGSITDLDHIEILGESIEARRRSFKSAFEVFKERYPGISIILGESACTGCICEMIGALSHVREAGFGEAMEGLKVIVGDPPEREVRSGKVLLFGKCAKHLAGIGPHVQGCPPREEEAVKAVCHLCGVDANEVISSRDRMRQRIWQATKANLEA